MSKKTFTATYGGHTATRTSARAYTHALALHFPKTDKQEEGWEVVSFHASEALKLRPIPALDSLLNQKDRSDYGWVTSRPVR